MFLRAPCHRHLSTNARRGHAKPATPLLRPAPLNAWALGCRVLGLCCCTLLLCLLCSDFSRSLSVPPCAGVVAVTYIWLRRGDVCPASMFGIFLECCVRDFPSLLKHFTMYTGYLTVISLTYFATKTAFSLSGLELNCFFLSVHTLSSYCRTGYHREPQQTEWTHHREPQQMDEYRSYRQQFALVNIETVVN